MWWTAAFALLAAPGRIVPYLEPGEQPLRPSEAAVRFVNVPAAAFRPIPEAENAAAGARAWRVAPDEAVAVVQLGAQLLEAARRAGVRFPRGSLKPPYHADSSADCCACAIEDPAWTRPPPAGEWQPGGAGAGHLHGCAMRCAATACLPVCCGVPCVCCSCQMRLILCARCGTAGRASLAVSRAN